MSIAESYVLTVQCDFCPDQRTPRRDQFIGRSASEAHKARREAGWQYYPAQMKAKCPSCAKFKGRKSP